MEQRSIRVEVRASQDGKSIEGYAAVFNQLSTDLGGFREQIAPGAFRAALAEKQDVLCVVDHDSARLLGRTSSGTCEVNEDENGLFFRCSMPNTRLGMDTMEMVRRGDISQCSFSFTTDEDQWDEMDDEDGESFVRRTLVRVGRLFDVSPVVSPAYPQTSVAVK